MGGNMKNKKITYLLVSMLVYATVITVAGTSIAHTVTQQSSGPVIEWIHTYDSIQNDKASYVDRTADGGYIFTGSTIVTPPYYTELLLIKTDGNGEESWYKHFLLTETNLYGTAVHQTTDGGYIIVGSVGYTFLWDVHVIKTDANGDLVWQKSFGNHEITDHGCDILQTSDGGYMVLGMTASYGHGSVDLWLIKLAADGTEQWNKTIGGETFDNANKFTKTNDGGYVIVGSTDATDSMGDIWVVKTNDAGEVSWQKTFGDSNIGEDAADVITESNGYTILGSLYDANWTESIWLLHLDAQGTLTSDHHIYGDGTLHGTSITKTTDGGYFVTGIKTNITNYVPDAYLLKVNYQGATQWIKTLDISEGLGDEATWGTLAPDGGYIAVGNTGDFNNFSSDTFLVKIKAENGAVLDSVTAGFGVHAHLKNLGTTEATDVSVSITITGGILHRINISHAETLTIPAGEEATFSCKPFLGLGPIDITVTVNGITNDYQGTQLIILTHLLS